MKEMLRFAQHDTGNVTLSEAKSLPGASLFAAEMLRYAQHDTGIVTLSEAKSLPANEGDASLRSA